MIDIIKTITGIVLLLTIIGFFAYVICANEPDMGIIVFFCFSIPLGGIIVAYLDKLIKERRQVLRKMYNIPERLDHEYGGQWGREFQKIIGDARKNTTDTAKLHDLQNCSQTVQNISKWPIVGMGDEYYMNAAFRYTGCHVKVTDSQGRIISEIV